MATHNCCPYELLPLASIAETSFEHIFPDALGGLRAYGFRASAKANSDLGKLIDAPLLKSFLISSLRFEHGIKSRSGDPELTFRGVIDGTTTKVEITFHSDGHCTAYVRNPVTIDGSGTKVELTVSAEDRDKFLKEFIDNHRKKGRLVTIAKDTSLVDAQIRADLDIDLLAIKRALAKIAYGALYELFGDEYLTDPLVAEWQKVLFSSSAKDIEDSRIHGVAFDAERALGIMLPRLEPYQHAVAIANIQLKGPVVAVSLFGRGFHSLVAMASETTNYGLEILDGKIAICDAKAATMTIVDFRDHFENMSESGMSL